MRSKVEPAVITTFWFAKIFGANVIAISSKMNSGSTKRPTPISPQAWLPAAGYKIFTPFCVANLAIFSWVIWFSHIWLFIAGASNNGHFCGFLAKTNAEIKSSANPWAIFAKQSAVAGAITKRSQSRTKWIWAIASLEAESSKMLVKTGFPEIAWKVSGVTNSVAALDITTWTWALAFLSKRHKIMAL